MIEATFDLNGLALNDFTDETKFYQIQQISGLAGFPSIRNSDTFRPGQHGLFTSDQFLGGKDFVIEGTFTAPTTLELNEMQQALMDALADGLSSDIYLAWQATGEIAKRIGFRLYDAPLVSETPDRRRTREYMIPCRAADPLIYSATEHSGNITLPTATGGRSYPKSYPIAYGTISTGGVLQAVNAGNIAVAPTIVIYGPVDNPRLRNVTQGLSLELAISLGATDTLTFDFKNKTVMLNVTAGRYSSLTVDDWWDLSPGNNEISYAASTYQAGSYALVSWRDGYLTA